ncbi:MAG: hypothetical protein RLZZ584_3085 [Pseudomonadota bacterium]|jgi:hypothetical protein
MTNCLPSSVRGPGATLAYIATALLLGLTANVQAQPHDHAAHMAAMKAAPAAAAGDTCQPMAFLAPRKEHTLARMRDHLLALALAQIRPRPARPAGANSSPGPRDPNEKRA